MPDNLYSRLRVNKTTLSRRLKFYFKGPIGFSLFLAWLYLSFYSCTLRPVLLNSRTMERFWGIMAASALVTVVAMSILNRRKTLALGRRAIWTSAIFCAGGSVIMYVFNVGQIGEIGFTFSGPAISGIGFAVFAFSWRQELSRLSVENSELAIPLSVACAIPIYFATTSLRLFANGLLSTAIVAILPLTSAAFACITATQQRASESSESQITQRVGLGDAVVSSAILFVVWLNVGFFRAIWSPMFASDRFSFYFSPFVVAAVISIGIFIAVLLYGKSISCQNARQVFRWAIPPACLAYAILCFGGRPAIEGAYTANFISIIIAQLYFWTAMVKLPCSNGRQASQQVFLIMLFALLAGGVCGIGFGLFVYENLEAATSPESFHRFVPIAMTALVTTMLLLETLEEKRNERRENTAADAPINNAQKAPSEQGMFNGAIALQVKTLNEKYGLTPRECEVLSLLLTGRSRPFIRDMLGISLSTVNTHVKNIYEKIGVHSYQDLLSHAQTGPDSYVKGNPQT